MNMKEAVISVFTNWKNLMVDHVEANFGISLWPCFCSRCL